MAKKGMIEKNNRRRAMVDRYADKRASLKALISNKEGDPEERFEAVLALAKLPRNSSKVRVRNRCNLTGRPRAYYRKFGLSRIALRDLASEGLVPGVVKASW
ncbi:MAG: 30S ribosomal protein S14 [Geminicoccaceae bacterium]|nr:30S ribosomal protein S14 [Geminicoccaceae bacterium]